uniref:Inter-alpha-trypsin inhibitor heavy chain H3-like n=1 Tax=Haplochromis burtoni TaxID=8153 RepID=A0A3Q2VGS6_HAPBU
MERTVVQIALFGLLLALASTLPNKVSSVGRTLEEFKTSVNVAAYKKVTFELTYEELMKRTHGKYELQIHARPMQPVRDFKVDVYIHEEAGISFINVKGGLSTKDLANAITKTHADKQAWVYFYPTVDQQKMCDSCGDQGMNGDLVIVYDVNRDNGLGHIKKSDGYFVHHFAPSDLPRIPKNVVFVIDQSGSMGGRKIEQVKYLKGARMLNAHNREGSASILILLTDGDPTSGVTNLEKIQSNVRQAIAGKFPLYCLGFGFDVNFNFLEKMSLQNNGVARRIYEDSDADLQLKGFYEEVATPLLTDVTMIYVGGTNLTQTNFSHQPSYLFNIFFVTPLTSMVVTKPPGENTDVLHKPKEGETPQRWQPRVDQGESGHPGAGEVLNKFIRSPNTRFMHLLFLLKAENQTVPLCFDVSGPVRLKLLHYPSRELSVNGELDSVTNGGFSRIFIHVKDSQHVEIDTNWVTVRDGQTVTYYTGQDQDCLSQHLYIVTVIVRNNEIDVATGDMRMVIIVHEKNGQKLFWPVLRRRPSDNNAEGLLGGRDGSYTAVAQEQSGREREPGTTTSH